MDKRLAPFRTPAGIDPLKPRQHRPMRARQKRRQLIAQIATCAAIILILAFASTIN